MLYAKSISDQLPCDKHSKLDFHVDLIPVVKLFLGPMGKNLDIAKWLLQLYSNLAFCVSDTESLSDAHNKKFFD